MLTDEGDLRKGEISTPLSKLNIYYTLKRKAHIITINLKYQLQHGMINLNYLMNHILCFIFKTIFSIFKKHNENIDSPSIRI